MNAHMKVELQNVDFLFQGNFGLNYTVLRNSLLLFQTGWSNGVVHSSPKRTRQDIRSPVGTRRKD